MKTLIIIVSIFVLFFIVLVVSKPGDSQIKEECTKYFLTESKSKALNTFEGESQIYNSITVEDHLIYKSAMINVLGTVNIHLASAYLWKVHFDNSSYDPAAKPAVDSVQLLRDSVEIQYNDALSRLDSITGANNNLQSQLSDRNSDISKLKSQINGILKKGDLSQNELRKIKDLVGQLNSKIDALETK